MTRDEAQRLLGGYATNSLSEAERSALFEAALDDQELFDALQHEQALKDLLDDEITRSEVRTALEESGGRASSRSWGRWWVWGLAGGLATAAAVSVVVLTTHPPASRPRVEMAMANKPAAAEQAAPPSAPPRPSEMMARLARREMEKKAEGRRSAREELTHAPADRKDLSAPPPPAAAPPPPSAPEPAIAAGQSQQSALQLETAQKELAAPAARANTLRDQEAGAAGQPRAAKGAISGSIAGFGGALGALKSPALSYSVLRRDENGRFAKLDANIAVRQGDLVRLAVTPAASGYLSLYERDANGAWKPIPLGSTNEEGVPVNANTQYVVPQQPIEVTAQEQIRLVLSPESAAADAVAERDAARAKTSAVERPTSRRAAPIAVDINLTRKN